METQTQTQTQTIEQVITEIQHAEAASGGHLVWTGELIESRTVIDSEHGVSHEGVVIAEHGVDQILGNYRSGCSSDQEAYELLAADLLAEDAYWRTQLD